MFGYFIRRIHKRALLHGIVYACHRIRYTWHNRFTDDHIDEV